MFKLLAFAFILVAVNASPAPAPHGYIAAPIAPVSYSYQSQVVHHPAPVVKTYVAHPAPIVPVVHHPAPLIKTYPAYVPSYAHSLYPLAYKAPLVYAPHY